jgi:hypothetical protein
MGGVGGGEARQELLDHTGQDELGSSSAARRSTAAAVGPGGGTTNAAGSIPARTGSRSRHWAATNAWRADISLRTTRTSGATTRPSGAPSPQARSPKSAKSVSSSQQ